ncbi:MAG: hypothetical protein Tsb0019_15900 [Roseibium sp.]
MALLDCIDSDDPTIKVVSETDRRLAILCHDCGRFRYMNSARFEAHQKISDLGEQLKCSACGSRDVDAVAVSRNPDNGYWPAERS